MKTYSAPNPYTTPIQVSCTAAGRLTATASITYVDGDLVEVTQRLVVSASDHRSDQELVAELSGIAADTVAKATARGWTLHGLDGSRVYRERRVDYHQGRPEFHQDGERVRCSWVEVTISPDGSESVRQLRRVWVSYDRAVE